jgi:hypothetical protein
MKKINSGSRIQNYRELYIFLTIIVDRKLYWAIKRTQISPSFVTHVDQSNVDSERSAKFLKFRTDSEEVFDIPLQTVPNYETQFRRAPTVEMLLVM